MMMDIEQIQEYLPHRYPFLLVDRVLELEPGEHIVAIKNLTINEELFQGHFPGRPVFPGVLAVEAMAQASAILGFKTLGVKPDGKMLYYLTGLDEFRFRRMLQPGDRVDLHSQLLSSKRGLARFKCRAEVDGEVACSGIIFCVYRQR